jgi:hypothetical protein
MEVFNENLGDGAMADDGRRWPAQGEADERQRKLCKQATLIFLLQYLSE